MKDKISELCNYFSEPNILETFFQALHTFPAENVLPLLAFHYVDTMETDPCLVYQYMSNGSVSDRYRLQINRSDEMSLFEIKYDN